MSVIGDSFQARCSRLFGGWWAQEDLSLRRIRNDCGLPDHMRSRLCRLLVGGETGPVWDPPLLERIVPVAARDLGAPPDDLLTHLMGGEAEFRQQYRDVELAAVLLPRPGYTERLGKKLEKHEADAARIIAIGKFLPVSLALEEVSQMHQRDMALRVGNTGLRRLPQMKKFAGERFDHFMRGEGVLNRGNAVVFQLLSDFMAMRDATGPFAGLGYDDYERCLQVLWAEVVLEREVQLLVIDDLQRPLPVEVRRFLHGYDAIGAIDNRFTLRNHAGKLTRTFCERTDSPSACNAHIDETVQGLESLRRYVTHPTTIAGIVELLKGFSRDAA